FKRILAPNGGELDSSIIYALKTLWIQSVAIYSMPDKDSLHVELADYAVCIGPPPPQDSYLNFSRIMSAAVVSGVDAIHPGYGFLAENPDFADLVEKSGFIFIGPSSQHIKFMGDKIEAKRLMKKAGIPVLPGTENPVDSLSEAQNIVRDIGLPVIIKAASGGGGRGMRIVRNPDALEKAFTMAQKEAEISFGDPRVYIEKYIENPRHIEVQIAADQHGNIIHLGERECSIQRRHQKLLEESPSPAVDENLRAKMGEAAIKGAQAINYHSLGTMEFLLDEDGNFYFMEMNTRIQVEHPVTEWVTGIDLVKTQILIAMGEKLLHTQEEINFKGHAIEVRINAEDPDNGFIPNPGRIEFLHFPGGPGVRIDTHIYQGYTIPPFYDSLIGKLIVHDEDRSSAIKRLYRALEETIIKGVKTTVPFYLKLLENEDFQKGNIDTHFLERFKW
ncbi:MAG TPA: acetyl-CoA carboxylase biotin carboxylase subunit, partial [candidate division WOR-3 bacterium]|nr:acetyl-CoA carboxylase biotin carboxylase subunit [candidate division WOR-3 bacterium]